MTRLPLFLVMLLTGALLLSACGDSDQNHPTLTTLTESDNGKTVELQVTDDLDVTLTENPSTGFLWDIDTIDQSVIKQTGDSEFTPGSGIGASGKRTFHFQAVASGQSDLKLILHRPFDTSTPPASTFEVTIIVK